MITLCAFFATWAIMLTYNLSVRNPLTVLIFAGLETVFLYSKKCETIKNKYPLLVGAFLLCISTVLVKYQAVISSFDNPLFKILSLAIILFGWFAFFFFLLRTIAKLYEKIPEKFAFADESKLKSGVLFWISFAVSLICYLPWYLYSFPGIMDPDTMTQMRQVVGINPYSNHHPVAHTFLIKIACKIAGIFTNDINKQVGFYTFLQMIFFSFCVAYVVYTLHRFMRVKTWICFVVLAFYSLVSFMNVHVVFICKDTVFAGFTMLFVCELVRFVYYRKSGKCLCNLKNSDCCNTDNSKEPDSGKDVECCNKESIEENNTDKKAECIQSKIDEEIEKQEKCIICRTANVVRFIILGVAFCLFRTNGWYAFLLFSVLFLLLFIKEWKKVLVRIIPVIALVLIIKGPVMNAMNIKQPDIAESLHVPEQQIAAVIANDRYLTDEEITLLNNVCDISYAKEFYIPWFADNIKELVRAGHPEVINENKFTYLKLWIKIGLRYPKDYINAWVALTENVIFPEGEYDVAIIEGVKSNELGLEWQPVISNHLLLKAREIIIKLGDFIPLYGFLWSMGSYTWIFIVALTLIFTNKKDCRKAIILLPAICIILTLLLAIPSAKMFRYAFSYATLLPFALCVFKKNN